jgi:hypothetical protein
VVALTAGTTYGGPLDCVAVVNSSGTGYGVGFTIGALLTETGKDVVSLYDGPSVQAAALVVAYSGGDGNGQRFVATGGMFVPLSRVPTCAAWTVRNRWLLPKVPHAVMQLLCLPKPRSLVRSPCCWCWCCRQG